MTAYASLASTNEIRSLTGLRGLAAIYVVLFHFTGNGQFGTGALRVFMSHGYLAVDLFFVLSGFVMGMNYGRRFCIGFTVDKYADFLARRIGRVYPLFLVTTLVCAALSVANPAMEGPLTAWTFTTNLSMAQAWGLAYSLNYPAWSISTEFAAYLLFPLLAMLLLGQRRALAALAACVVVSMMVFVASQSGASLHEVESRCGPLDVWSSETLFPVLRCLAGFSIGVLAWRGAQWPSMQLVCGRPAIQFVLPLTTAALLCFPGTDVVFVLLCGPLIVCLAANPSPVARALTWSPLYGLGVVSYSLYLVHYPLRWALASALQAALAASHIPHPGAATAALLLTLSVMVAPLAYCAIERPGRDLSRKFLQRKRHASPALAPGVTRDYSDAGF